MVIGGTNINRERSGLNSSRCDLLIATPGRLNDHLESTPGFAGRLWGVQVCLYLFKFLFACAWLFLGRLCYMHTTLQCAHVEVWGGGGVCKSHAVERPLGVYTRLCKAPVVRAGVLSLLVSQAGLLSQQQGMSCCNPTAHSALPPFGVFSSTAISLSALLWDLEACVKLAQENLWDPYLCVTFRAGACGG
jgi:hypothetical protein